MTDRACASCGSPSRSMTIRFNTRLEAPGDLQLTLFTELDGAALDD